MSSEPSTETPESGLDDDSGPTDPSGSSIRAVVVALLMAFVGIALGSVLVIAGALGLRVLGVEITPLLAIVLSLVLATGVGFGGVAAAYLRYRGYGWSWVGVRVPTFRDLVFVAVGFLGAFGLAISASYVVTTLGVQTAQNQAAQTGFENPEVLLILIPAAILIIGPGEELLFRGVVQRRLREVFSPVIAIPFASLIFAAIHYTSLIGAPSARLVTISVLVLPTLVFGTVYELTDNIVVPALTHGIYNATLFSILYLGIKFADSMPQGGFLLF
ncbi:CPBP family intramembrane glutamic endopeptidase [Halopelagius fulvigenes]|uniref:CPBP family intramembrane glutamic endopeptidase n=1 Tax=Halopelagius fulvigenes TaxID=1198324 RepID=A0ABD5TZI0_9EURY